MMREGLKALLSAEEDLQVIGEAADGMEAMDLCRKLHPDVAVIDVGMPNLNGVTATQNIIADNPHIRVLALSMHTGHEQVISMLKAGALGYVAKDSAFDELSKAIRSVHAGQTYVSASIAGPVLQRMLEASEEKAGTIEPLLSAREQQVLQLIAEGKGSKQISTILGVSLNTVIRHRQNIMDKLNLHTVADLTRYAIRERLILP